ncbi:MAG: hypothetical protein ACKVQQ_04825 [Burkholderiales bacterium]
MTDWRLGFALVMRRGGWWVLAGVLLLALAVALEAWMRPAQLGKARAAETERTRLLTLPQHPPAAAAGSQAAERTAAFRSVLARDEALPQLLRGMFAEAERQGLAIASADYRMTAERDGRYRTYRMIAPVRGTYPQVRTFVDRVLRAYPALALEDASFKRENATQAVADVRLSFVFFLVEGGPQ